MINYFGESEFLPIIHSDSPLVDVSNPSVRDEINFIFFDELDCTIPTIEAGYYRIGYILNEIGYGPISMSGKDIYGLEFNRDIQCYLYVVHFKSGSGYRFHVELVTEEELNEILSLVE